LKGRSFLLSELEDDELVVDEDVVLLVRIEAAVFQAPVLPTERYLWMRRADEERISAN